MTNLHPFVLPEIEEMIKQYRVVHNLGKDFEDEYVLLKMYHETLFGKKWTVSKLGKFYNEFGIGFQYFLMNYRLHEKFYYKNSVLVVSGYPDTKRMTREYFKFLRKLGVEEFAMTSNHDAKGEKEESAYFTKATKWLKKFGVTPVEESIAQLRIEENRRVMVYKIAPVEDSLLQKIKNLL